MSGALVFFESYDFYSGIGELLEDFGGVVGGMVVDDD